MNIKKTVTIFVMMLCSTVNVYAEGSRIGFVNINLLLQKAPQAQAATSRLEEAFGDRKIEVLDFQKRCKKMGEDLEKEGAALSKQQKQRKLLKIRSCSSELKLMDEEYGADLRIAQAEELQKLQKLVFKMVDRVAKDEQFDLIVNESVIFASPRVDISRTVLNALKSMSGNGDNGASVETAQ
ncbi:MAG: OmpH family outer membrane protein [Gammaproteobacteria bacterium]|uniref:OmpH family outer membrane protein n=1 Tax=Candidatus Thiopontia autotrophica TaxID=2841688 RepID=A0A8J6NYI9_9GAMM|nr:OmpH family outer membrane protein [Candidatus Thiopontia autotrophica]MBL6968917.1 OmpH family outer membrane protein [Gammaproteobacteria bacterium]